MAGLVALPIIATYQHHVTSIKTMLHQKIRFFVVSHRLNWSHYSACMSCQEKGIYQRDSWIFSCKDAMEPIWKFNMPLILRFICKHRSGQCFVKSWNTGDLDRSNNNWTKPTKILLLFAGHASWTSLSRLSKSQKPLGLNLLFIYLPGLVILNHLGFGYISNPMRPFKFDIVF